MTTIVRPEPSTMFARLQVFWKNLKTWDSLVTKLIALVIAMGLISLCLHVAVMVAFAMFVSNGLTYSTGNMIKHERALLRNTPFEKRIALAAELSTAKHRIQHVTKIGTSEKLRVSQNTFFEDPILAKLRREVGPDIHVTIDSNNRLLNPPGLITFGFEIDGQPWEIEYELESPFLVVLGSLLGWLTLITLTIVMTSVVGVTLVSRPLKQLAMQLGVRSPKPEPLIVPNRSSKEVRDLVGSFNQLIEINARAEAAKQHMLAGVSHDLRTPLTRLRFRVEMACDPKTIGEFSADLDALERIVSQFLGYSQGQTDVVLGEPWSLNEVVSRIVSSYTMQGAPVLFEESDVSLMLPDLAVQRALTNLIDNALEYGGKPVEVALASTVDNGREQVSLTVWDHGPGLTAEEFAQARRPFSRLAGDNKPSGHCGLGLAIIEQIVAQTGGVLELTRDATGRFGLAMIWHR